jgi:hypothetical protein
MGQIIQPKYLGNIDLIRLDQLSQSYWPQFSKDGPDGRRPNALEQVGRLNRIAFPKRFLEACHECKVGLGRGDTILDGNETRLP